MIGLWFVWYFTGGPERYERNNPGPYIEPIGPGEKGNTYGSPERGYKDYFK